MPKYQIKVLEVHAVYVDVEADTECEARDKANDLLSDGCYPDGTDLPEPVYDYTMPIEEWKWSRE